MGWPEHVLECRARESLQLVDEEVKALLLQIINVITRSNANMAYKRRIYRAVTALAYHDMLSRHKKAEDAVTSLEKINFLLPKEVRENLDALKIKRDELKIKIEKDRTASLNLELKTEHKVIKL